MDLEREIALLKEKVALLEKVRDLQEMVRKAEAEKVYVPYPVYPVYPTYPWEPWKITYETGTTFSSPNTVWFS